MKSFKLTFHPFRAILYSALFIAFLGIQSCGSSTQTETSAPEEKAPAPPVMEIVTETMDFQMPDTIPAGWYTWRYHNNSNQTHFILIDDYPDGITLDSIKARVLPVFGNGMTLLNEGKTDEGFAEFANLPSWFSEVVWRGGVGLVSPEVTTESTLKLNPGTYFVECYVKMNTGMFHTNMGMIKKLVVSNEVSSLAEPKADISIRLSGESGISVDPPSIPGSYTFKVEFLDQKIHENFVSHDLNLVRLQDNANLKDLEAWMDWRDPKGLIEPAPEGVIFLGGVNDMPAGDIGYFTAQLVPGQYAFVSEVPNASGKNLLKVFEITQ
ncbi:MAG: hypothetical protein HWE15_14310 [Algoriphagus sp.]|uniref:hypothetical protein n=1 Tax=Algoriphagus sp. TaxID=1872435 RepID=UPI001857F5D6|nr:hypothetical protein [Algoriphagus sp.]NVJ87479.1 hypothetical protein [Algoriphagus sp.]